MAVDPAEHIGKPGFGGDVISFSFAVAMSEVDRCRPFAAAIGSAEGPVPATEGDTAKMAMGGDDPPNGRSSRT